MGTNSRLDELQAAILRVKLRYLDAWNETRRRHARTYEDAFQRCRLDGVMVPSESPGCVHVYHLYTVRFKERARVKEALATAGIATQIAYPSTLPAQPALTPWVRGPQEFPRAEEAARTVLSLPLYPELPPDAIARIVAEIARALGRSPDAGTALI